MSSASPSNKVEELFAQVVDLPEAEQAALLAQHRAAAPDVVGQVERLLAADQHLTGRFLSRPLWSFNREEGHGDFESPASVGGYQIERVLGKGGMGAVYLGRHTATGRLVALKLLRPGIGSRRHLERFRLEAETLARLSEPRIAQLYDAGMTMVEYGDGVRAERPFIAMEYVAGRSIVEEAAARRLGIHDRLKIVEGVARAVQHAHQRGVIHRDLKPGNILIGEDGTPKVVDFGIARLLDAGDDGLTMTGQVLGTTRYMSPEQATGNNLNVDTRTDVYSLGAVLYELLADRPIIDVESASSFSAMAQVMQARPPQLGTLNPAFRGDIAAVVHKAIEREPAHRYQSAGDFADDLARLVRGDGVEARTPTTVERFIRSAKRNKPLSAAIAIAAAAMTTGTAVSVWQARKAMEQAIIARAHSERANEEAARANDATVEAKEHARRADERAAETMRQRDLLVGTRDAQFEGNVQMQTMVAKAASRSRVVREAILESMNETLQMAERTPSRSLIRQASAYDGISQFYEALGEPHKALEWRTKTVQLLERAGHPEDVLLLTNRALVATLTFYTDPNADFAACEKMIADCRRKLLGEMSESESIQLRLAQAHSQVFERLGRFEDSEKNYLALLEVLRRAGDKAHMTRHVSGLLGVLYRKTGRYAEALPLVQSVVKGLEEAGAPATDISGWLDNLGFIHEQLADDTLAAEAYGKMEVINQRVFGDAHFRTAQARGRVARILGKLRTDDDRAMLLFGQAIDAFRVMDPPQPRELSAALNGLCGVHLRLGRPDAAAPLLTEALELVKGGSIETDTLLQGIKLNEATLLRARNDDAEAEAILLSLEKALGGAEEPLSPIKVAVATQLADLYEAQGRTEEASSWRKRLP